MKTTILDAYGYSIGVKRWNGEIPRSNFIVKTAHSQFDKALFSVPHLPLVIGEVDDRVKFSYAENTIGGIRVNNCPIKLPGSNDYRVPRAFDQFDEVLAKIVAFEHAINEYSTQYYAYLTVDQSSIAANQYHFINGAQPSGFQGIFPIAKRPIVRHYFVYDRVPQRFYCQAFSAKDDGFWLLPGQAKEECAVEMQPYLIIAANDYSIHKATTVNYPFYRTLLRLTFTTVKHAKCNSIYNSMFAN